MIVPAVAVKVPLLDPAEIVRLAGTVSAAKLLDKFTVAVLVAGLDSVTVQVLLWPLLRVLGEQDTLESCGGEASVRDAVRVVPPAVAVTVAVWSADTAVTVAVKVAVVAPAATVTEPGTDTFALLSEVVTTKPPEGAAPLSETVHVELPAPVTVDGEQLKPVSDTPAAGGIIEMDEPVADMDSVVPCAVEASGELIVTGRLEATAPAEIENAKLAICPLPITVVFMPKTRQVVEPVPLTHEILLPEPVTALPAVAVTAVTSAG